MNDYSQHHGNVATAAQQFNQPLTLIEQKRALELEKNATVAHFDKQIDAIEDDMRRSAYMLEQQAAAIRADLADIATTAPSLTPPAIHPLTSAPAPIVHKKRGRKPRSISALSSVVVVPMATGTAKKKHADYAAEALSGQTDYVEMDNIIAKATSLGWSCGSTDIKQQRATMRQAMKGAPDLFEKNSAHGINAWKLRDRSAKAKKPRRRG